MRTLAFFLATAGVLAAQAPAQKPLAVASAAAKPATAAAPAPKNFKEIGLASAPITIEVYSDYECPSCRGLWIDTMPSVMREYVQSGKVRIIHRDFPLPQHQHTREATKYANAAGQIGRYELVFEQIFKTQPTWTVNGNVDAEVTKVLPPGEMQKVREIVKNDSHLDDSVNAELAMGQRDAIGETPTMFITYKGKREKVAGYLPYNILKSYLDQKLSK
jgi:protein-disulfide isomerase